MRFIANSISITFPFALLAQIQFVDLPVNEAFLSAKKQDKIVFLYGASEWCEPCEVLEDYTFSDLEVASYYNDRFISLKVDMEKYPGIELAEVYDVFIYPSMLFLDSDGKVIHRGCGAMEASELLGLGKNVFGDSTLKFYQEKYLSGEFDTDFLLEYIDLQQELCLNAESFAQSLINEISLQDLVQERSFLLMENYQWNIFSREFQYLMQNKDVFYNALGKDRVDDKLYNTFLAQYEEIYEAEELYLFAMQALLNELGKVKFTGSDTLSVMINLNYYETIEDWERFSEGAVTWVGMTGTNDSEELNELAWKFYLYVEDEQKLNLAANWAKQAVDESPEPSAIDTYASLLFKLGNIDQAIELEEKALEMASELLQDTSHYEHQLAKFRKKT